MTRIRKFLLAALVIIIVITALWLICHFIIPFIFYAFIKPILDVFIKVFVIIVIIIAAFMAFDS